MEVEVVPSSHHPASSEEEEAVVHIQQRGHSGEELEQGAVPYPC